MLVILPLSEGQGEDPPRFAFAVAVYSLALIRTYPCLALISPYPFDHRYALSGFIREDPWSAL